MVRRDCLRPSGWVYGRTGPIVLPGLTDPLCMRRHHDVRLPVDTLVVYDTPMV